MIEIKYGDAGNANASNAEALPVVLRRNLCDKLL